MRYDISRDEFKIAGLEDPIEYCYPISNGRFVNLAGRADRIDTLDKNTLQIIDYKSSNNQHLEYNSIHTLFNGTPKERISNIFQTILYSMMLHKSSDKDICPSLFFASKMLSKDYSPYIVDNSLCTEEDSGEIKRYSRISESFEMELTKVFEEIFDDSIEFTQATDVGACEWCDYKKICRR